MRTDKPSQDSRARLILRAMLTIDHFYVRYNIWKLWYGLDLSGVSLDHLGFDKSLRGHSDTGGPRLASVLRGLAIPRNWPAVDIGSGKGGACFTLLNFFDEVLGVELSPELLEVAKSNQYKLRIEPHRDIFVEGDARLLDYDRFQVFYMANPFGKEVAQSVLERIETSLRRRMRAAVLIVYHPTAIEDWIQPSLFKLEQVRHFSNSHPFYVFRLVSS